MTLKDEARVKLTSIVQKLEKEMRCNCDLDNWEPERSTLHSCDCRIHKTAWARLLETLKPQEPGK